MGNSSSATNQVKDDGELLWKQPYPYSQRRTPYRSEQLELNADEEALVRRWVADCSYDEGNSQFSRDNRDHPIILDTDCGTDVDDALALLYVLGSIEKGRLLGVTTCYGPTELRAKIVRLILDGAGWNDVRVIAGAGVPCGTHRPIWTTGTEGLEVLSSEEIQELKRRNLDESDHYRDSDRHLDAARFIVDQIRSRPSSSVHVVCIGPLTNLALALQLDPGIAERVACLTFMGQGKPRKEGSPIHGASVNYTNHNISSDTAAACCVFAAPFRRLVVINDAVTNRCWFQGAATESLLRWWLGDFWVVGSNIGRCSSISASGGPAHMMGSRWLKLYIQGALSNMKGAGSW